MDLLLPADKYVFLREKYDYNSPNCKFVIEKTDGLDIWGEFEGIFAKRVPYSYPKGINLRMFEKIVQEIFKDCDYAFNNNSFTKAHEENLKQVSTAIVYWKMASQGGRAKLKVKNLLTKWNDDTKIQLLKAYEQKDMALFRIGGVRIPIATAFIRFLFPDEFGIMDSRVVGRYTQPKGITTLSLRSDGYINDTKQNVVKYNKEYIAFLRKEVELLNNLKITYKDIDTQGNEIISEFRVCDIEMALFV
ncbi:MAG: hypothetical protein PWP68_563 [Rikenellaceae bacterium]|nr:hypothetical protein [Rikenellaceae bacterium]